MKEKLRKDLAVVILAAGKGTRMNSSLPKALHEICGKPMLWHLVVRARELGAKKIIVVAGYKAADVKAFVGNTCQVVLQEPQLGSGHAVMQAARALGGFKGSAMVLYCDTPLVGRKTLSALYENHYTGGTDCSLLSVKAEDPTGYGRIKRSEMNNNVEKIVEQNDASHLERAIKEINVGCYVFKAPRLFDALKAIKKNAGKNEYYLTDVIEILAKDGKVDALVTEDADETHGVNTAKDLWRAEELMQRRVFENLAEQGVRLRDPKTIRIEAGVRIGRGTLIESHTVIEEDSVIGENSVIGPFARIRGASVVGDHSVIGNFVELVRSKIGNRTQVKHLSYLGDTRVADGVNVGAGTITANFDGKKKHQTTIKDGASLGSGTILIAPVTIGRQAKTGAGAVVTRGSNVKDKNTVVGVPAKRIKGKI